MHGRRQPMSDGRQSQPGGGRLHPLSTPRLAGAGSGKDPVPPFLQASRGEVRERTNVWRQRGTAAAPG